MHALLAWFHAHGLGLAWGAAVSVLVCIAGLIATPWLVARIPSDYFTAPPHPTSGTGRGLQFVLKNCCGYLLIALGLALLVLPGPGVLTILLGVVLVDLPGKRRLVSWLLARPSVLTTINGMRERRGRPPLQLPRESEI